MKRTATPAPPVRRFAALAAAVAVAVAGCSSSSGTPTIAKADVEKKATAALTKQVGTAPKDITCPADLDATKGATERCVLTAPNGDRLGMSATVTGVTGDQYHLSFKVDTTIMTPGASSPSA